MAPEFLTLKPIKQCMYVHTYVGEIFRHAWLSDPVEKKMKEGKRRKKRLLYLHLKLSLGLVPL